MNEMETDTYYWKKGHDYEIMKLLKIFVYENLNIQQQI